MVVVYGYLLSGSVVFVFGYLLDGSVVVVYGYLPDFIVEVCLFDGTVAIVGSEVDAIPWEYSFGKFVVGFVVDTVV